MKDIAVVLGIVGVIIIFIALTVTIGEIFGFLPVLYFWGVIMLLISFVLYKKDKLNKNDL